jgi:VWFA-related protein
VRLLLPFVFAAALAAQEPTLRTTVRLVISPATVTDAGGKYIEGLNAEDFLVYDNGKPQRIEADFTYVPISLVIAVQSNTIAAEALNKVHRIGGMIEPLIIGERGDAAVVSFDEQVGIVQDFTSDTERIAQALKRLQPSGTRARMVDAVAQSVRILAAKPPTRRRVILLIGESRDRSSETKLEDAITLAQRENVPVYALSYSAFFTAFTSRPGTTPAAGPFDIIGVFREIGRLGTANAAEAFARFTGGGHLSFLRQNALEQAVSRIGEELHSQYLLSFTSGAEDSEFHTIEVKVKNRPELVVRARPGYWLDR